MSKKILKAIELIRERRTYLKKRITANDSGSTGSHQSGIHIDIANGRMMFEDVVSKGENRDKFITIEWADTGLTENCRFVFYGRGKTNNEFRITRLNRRFVQGEIFILVMITSDNYVGFIFNEYEDQMFIKLLNQ